MTKNEVIIPESHDHWLSLRADDVTSTEVPALFDLSPYMTKFELWHRKKERAVVKVEQSNRMKWGTRLQDSIASGIAEDQGWKLRKMPEYIRDPARRLGASFDFEINDDGLLEIKNVDALMFREGWIIDEAGNLEAPAHIELQLQQQFDMSKKSHGYIGALVGGNEVKLIEREADLTIIKSIHTETEKFWQSIEKNQPPKPDFARDASFIFSMFNKCIGSKAIDVKNNAEIIALAEQYRMFGEQEKSAKEGKSASKAQILQLIGDAAKAHGETFTISAGEIASTRVEAYDRVGYRDFRINWKKVKK